MRIVNEISDTIKALAKKAGKEKEAEKLWKKAIKIAEDERGKKEKDFKDKDFAYTTGVFKNMLGLKEGNLKEDFKKGDKVTSKKGGGVVVGNEGTSPPMVKVKMDSGKEMVFRVRELKMKESKVSFLECDTDARSWLETQFPKEEDEIEETMVSGSATSVGLPSKPMKIEVEEEDERDDRELIVDDREPLDK